MHFSSHYRKQLIFSLIFGFLVFLGASLYIHQVQSNYVLQTKLKIAEQEKTLATIAEVTSRDGADSVVANIIKDCDPTSRARFDLLLGKLSQLKGNDLIETQQLFNTCGNFYAQRKAVMVARLQREYEVYKDFIEILSVADKKAITVTYPVADWGTLVDLETKRSQLSTKLVDVQGQIIQELLKKTPIASDKMQSLLSDGQETKGSLLYTSNQIDTLRQKLLNL